MNNSVLPVIILILLIIFLVIGSFGISVFLSKRAMKTVIKSLREQKALSPETAKLPVELGIKAPGFIKGNVIRDYKPTVLHLLQKQEIVRMLDDGRVYLYEPNFIGSELEKRIYDLNKSRGR